MLSVHNWKDEKPYSLILVFNLFIVYILARKLIRNKQCQCVAVVVGHGCNCSVNCAVTHSVLLISKKVKFADTDYKGSSNNVIFQNHFNWSIVQMLLHNFYFIFRALWHMDSIKFMLEGMVIRLFPT